jgi:hypothetical protein
MLESAAHDVMKKSHLFGLYIVDCIVCMRLCAHRRQKFFFFSFYRCLSETLESLSMLWAP